MKKYKIRITMEEDSRPYLIYIKTLTGRVWGQEVEATEAVGALKCKIEDKQNVPAGAVCQ